jgi:hypothetical protein
MVFHYTEARADQPIVAASVGINSKESSLRYHDYSGVTTSSMLLQLIDGLGPESPANLPLKESLQIPETVRNSSPPTFNQPRDLKTRSVYFL